MEYAYLKELVAKRLPGLDLADPEATAKAVHAACIEYCNAIGMNPEIETALKAPGEQMHIPTQQGWTVVFEAGPHDWGVNLSFFLLERGPARCEPYYGFDLTFYPAGY